MRFKGLFNSKGQATVETAFAVAFYVVFLFSITDIARIAYTWATLQYVLNDSSRWGSVQTTTTSRGDMVKNKVISQAAGLYVPLQAADITVSPEVESSFGFFNLKARAKVNVSPLSGILLMIVADDQGNDSRSRVYTVTAETMIRNESL